MPGIETCILYRDFSTGDLLKNMAGLIRQVENGENPEEQSEIFFNCIHQLVELAETYGFSGNLWHVYLAFLLVNKENAFSMACEITGCAEGTINQVAEHDLRIFQELFRFDLGLFQSVFPFWDPSMITEYDSGERKGRMLHPRMCEEICSLAKTLAGAECIETFLQALLTFYKKFGVGELGLHKAFRIADGRSPVQIVPIAKIAPVSMDDLVGYQIPKKQLIENTEAFVSGRKANNCLLFGDAGTGKSSSIKGILNKYYDRGLRIIEIYKHQFQYLNDVIARIKNRHYKFIIYMDDLSFEEFEIEYKYLKAVIEGGLEKKPENILIYATSNRRHLIREKFSDKDEEDDLHRCDTVQEKLSLVSRFGVTIYFGAPGQKEFQEIVKTLAVRHGIQMPEKQLLLEANQWELRHGGLSGRTAQQFIDYLCGRSEEGGN